MAIAKGRWATIVKETGEVQTIAIMEGGVQPEVNSDAAARYVFEEVDEGVMIGMVRGGPVKSVGGFGFADGDGPGGRFGPGVTRMADTRPRVDETALPAVDHGFKQRGTEAPVNESAASSAKADKPTAKRKRA